METPFAVTVKNVTVFIMKHGQDVVMLHTSFLDPLNFGDDTETLDLQFRAPRMRGEAFVRQTWPDASVTVKNWSEEIRYVNS